MGKDGRGRKKGIVGGWGTQGDFVSRVGFGNLELTYIKHSYNSPHPFWNVFPVLLWSQCHV
jgi:hypothetical protein